ncbi:MAG: hypothetical protein ABIU55_02420 [Ferruginibacter sp.]
MSELPNAEFDTITPRFIQLILNVDKIVVLGNFMVKIDLENHFGMAINADLPNAYNFLKNNDSNAVDMMVFTDEEDYVFDILEAIDEGSLQQRDYKIAKLDPEGILRKCKGAKRLKDNGLEIWDRRDMGKNYCGVTYFGIDNKVVYQKFIIFFSLHAKMLSLYSCNGKQWPSRALYDQATLKLVVNAKYVKVNSCDFEWNKSFNRDQCDLTFGYWVIHWRGYRGSRALKKYDFSANFYVKHFSGASPNCLISDFYSSRGYSIADGY